MLSCHAIIKSVLEIFVHPAQHLFAGNKQCILAYNKQNFLLTVYVIFTITKVFRSSTGFSDGAILKPGQIEIPQDYFAVVVLCIVHQVL